MTTIKARTRRPPRGGPCSFCGHSAALHTGNDTGSTGCAAPQCPQTPGVGSSGLKLGRCAVYTSPAAHARDLRWEADVARKVSLSAEEVAQEIHFARYGNRDHSKYSSCGCTHEAMGMLGFKLHPKRGLRPKRELRPKRKPKMGISRGDGPVAVS